jgi:hypothetical protein
VRGNTSRAVGLPEAEAILGLSNPQLNGDSRFSAGRICNLEVTPHEYLDYLTV